MDRRSFMDGQLRKQGMRTDEDLKIIRNGDRVVSAGIIRIRQRPVTAKVFLFISMEDETGITNDVVTPDQYQKYRVVIKEAWFLYVEGVVQNPIMLSTSKLNTSLRLRMDCWL